MGVGVAPISVIELTKNKLTKWMGGGRWGRGRGVGRVVTGQDCVGDGCRVRGGEGGGVWAELVTLATMKSEL